MATPPRIVILDGFTLNPGDLSWSALAELGQLELHEHTPPELVLERARGMPIVLTNKTILTGDTLKALPELRFIGVLATGYNVVDIATAAERGTAASTTPAHPAAAPGLRLSNVPAYAAPSVAQAVFSLLLELATHPGNHARAVAAGRWAA